MNNINRLIDELIDYGRNTSLIEEADIIFTRNRLLELFEEDTYEESTDGDSSSAGTSNKAPASDTRALNEILDDMIAYASSKDLAPLETINEKDLYDTKIMGLITPPPSVVRKIFADKYASSPKDATDWYYNFSKATNYIRTDRIAKDEKWIANTEFGKLDITINLSKPEKDPRDIAKAGKAKASGYPSCLLCAQNEGYVGRIDHPARQNHRVVPMKLAGENYYLQYSPYVYYNEHCIIFNEKHIPMKIDRAVFEKLLGFVGQFPHYTAGSNADLPIVGGSILSHDHFQGGGYEFPMVRAPFETMFELKDYPELTAGIVRWPLSTIRLQASSPEVIVDAAEHILNNWRGYSDEDLFIFAETDGTPHNTITPIARMRGDKYELDLVLRNNITTDEFPLGVYHPHQEYHHIKKENIGLIEVMGLAVLPARLKNEMELLEEAILSDKDISADERIASHADWAKEFIERYNINSSIAKEELHSIVKQEIGVVFSHVLENAGVYKQTDEGKSGFMRFIKSL